MVLSKVSLPNWSQIIVDGCVEPVHEPGEPPGHRTLCATGGVAPMALDGIYDAFEVGFDGLT